MIKTVGTALCGMAITLSAASIGFQNPVAWRTVRDADMTVTFLADSTVEGETMNIRLMESNGTAAASSSIEIAEGSNSLEISAENLLSSGTDYYSLEWEVEGDTLSGAILPFAIAPVLEGIDPNAVEVPSSEDEITLENASSSEALSVSLIEGDDAVRLSWTPDALIIAVSTDEQAVISLDPANMKGGFLAFSNREIIVNGAEGTVRYRYNSRSLTADAVAYSSQVWQGDMSDEASDAVVLVTVPWYDLGLKPFENRQLGIRAAVSENAYPAGSSRTAPSTWGNILLK